MPKFELESGMVGARGEGPRCCLGARAAAAGEADGETVLQALDAVGIREHRSLRPKSVRRPRTRGGEGGGGGSSTSGEESLTGYRNEAGSMGPMIVPLAPSSTAVDMPASDTTSPCLKRTIGLACSVRW